MRWRPVWSVGLKARAVFRYSLQFQVEPELRERVPLFPWWAAPRRTKQKASKPTSVSAWRLRFEGGLKEKKNKIKKKTSFKTGNLTPLPLSMRKHREEVHCPPGTSASVRGFFVFFPPPAKEEDGSSLSRTLAQRRWEECILIPERWPWGAQHCYAPQHPHSHAHTLTHQDFCFFFFFFLTCVTGSCRLASSFLLRGNEQCTIRSFISIYGPC